MNFYDPTAKSSRESRRHPAKNDNPMPKKMVKWAIIIFASIFVVIAVYYPFMDLVASIAAKL